MEGESLLKIAFLYLFTFCIFSSSSDGMGANAQIGCIYDPTFGVCYPSDYCYVDYPGQCAPITYYSSPAQTTLSPPYNTNSDDTSSSSSSVTSTVSATPRATGRYRRRRLKIALPITGTTVFLVISLVSWICCCKRNEKAEGKDNNIKVGVEVGIEPEKQDKDAGSSAV